MSPDRIRVGSGEFTPPEPKKKLWSMPDWCHHHCNKMRLSHLETGENRLVIRGSAAEVIIVGDKREWGKFPKGIGMWTIRLFTALIPGPREEFLWTIRV